MGTVAIEKPNPKCKGCDVCTRAFIVRGADLVYYVKRYNDGEIVCARLERADAKHAAESLGYEIVNF